MHSIDTIFSDIKNLKIQGATNVALAIIDALEHVSESQREAVGKRLAYARPTEPLAQNILRYKGELKNYKNLITDAKKMIIDHGSKLIKSDKTYLTHCHASSVTSVFLNAKVKNFHVYATETRPLYQGRRTAKELLDGGIDITMIVDSAVATVFDQKNIAAVFIGADLLTEHGFANKIGSLAIAELAKAKNIPVYCCSTLLKYDPVRYTSDRIEQRDPKEIWPEPPNGLKFYSPAFDFIPYTSHINIVCEAGVISGSMVKEAVSKKYPFIFHG